MIEQAKSSRSRCRTCRQPIAKGTPRFGVLDTSFHERGSYQWHHLACADRELSHALATYLASPDATMTKAEVREALQGERTAAAALPAWLVGKGGDSHGSWFNSATIRVTGPEGVLCEEAADVLTSVLRSGDRALIERTEAWLTPSVAGAFALALLEQFEARGTLRSAWVYGALEDWLRHGSLKAVADSIVRRLKSRGSKDRADRLVQLLVDVGTDEAVLTLLQLNDRYRYKGSHNRIIPGLAAMARARKVSVVDLLDTVTLGLEQDSLRLDLGGRVLTGRVTPELKIRLMDGDTELGRLALRSSDDPVRFEAAKQRLNTLRGHLQRLATQQRRRFELAMSTSAFWSPTEFSALVAHPISGAIARGLVWWQHGRAFRVDEAGDLCDLDDEPVALTEAVRVAHATDLGAQIAEWADVFADYEIMAPFEQLMRPVDLPEASGEIWDAHPPFVMDQGPLHAAMNRRGWMKGEVEDDVLISAFYKTVGPFTFGLSLSPGMLPWGDDEPQTIEYAECDGDWAEVPAALRSEVLYDLRYLATLSRSVASS